VPTTAAAPIASGGHALAAPVTATPARSPAPVPGVAPKTSLISPASPAPLAAQGYWVVSSDGGVYTVGGTGFFGSGQAVHLSGRAVALVPTPDSHGYWMASSDGGVYTFGDAGFFGAGSTLRLTAPVVGLAATPDGQGYWLVTADGGVYSFGDAGFFGSAPAATATDPVVALTSTPDGQGYWVVTAKGEVSAMGDAPSAASFATSAKGGSVPGDTPAALGATPASSGSASAFLAAGLNSPGATVSSPGATLAGPGPASVPPGVAPLFGVASALLFGGPVAATLFGPTSTGASGSPTGSPIAPLPLTAPVVGLAATPDGAGYWLVSADGGVYSFGDAGFFGAGATAHVAGPVIGLTSSPSGEGYWMQTAQGAVSAFGDASPTASFVGASTLAAQLSGSTGLPLTAPVVGLALPTRSALSDIPMSYVVLDHAAAATCSGLPWTVLAAIGKVESDFGRSTLPGVQSGTNSAGAAGPMQMGITGAAGETFQAYQNPVLIDATPTPTPAGVDPHDPWDPTNAVYAAARDLCTNGAGDPSTLRQAILAYNHSDAYAEEVQGLSQLYAGHGGSFAAVALATSQLGTPYVWGGATPGVSFDCSGLVQWIYSRLGIEIPRTSQDQWAALPHLPSGVEPAPGNLVFFGPADGPTHVGLYVGNGLMIDAPHAGAAVRIEPYQWDDYLGAAVP